MKISFTKTSGIAILTGVILLALVYMAPAVYLNSLSFRNLVLEKINGAMDGSVTFSDHHIALHTAELELSKVRLTDASQSPLASMERLRINLSLPALLWRTVHVTSIEMVDARVDMRYDLQDQLQLIKPTGPATPQAKGPEKKWALRIDDFRMLNGKLDYHRPSKGWSAKADGIMISAGFHSARPTGKVDLKTGPLQWRQAGTAHAIAELSLSAAVDANRHITLAMETPKGRIEASGQVDWKRKNPLFDLVCDLKVDPTLFKDLIPRNLEIESPLKARIAGKGTLEDPTVTIKAHLPGAKAMGVDIDDFSAHIGMDQRRLSIHGIRTKSRWGSVDIKGHADLQAVFVDGLDLATARWDRVSYNFKIIGDELQPHRLGMKSLASMPPLGLRADLSGSGLKEDNAEAQALIELNVSNQTSQKGTRQNPGRLRAEIRRMGAAIDLVQLQAALDGFDIEANAHIDLSTHHIDQARARFQWEHLEGVSALMGTQLPSGNGHMTLNGRGPFKRPTATIDLLANDLMLAKYPLGRLLAKARLDENGVINLASLVLENQGSLVEGSGRVSLLKKEGGISADPGIDLDLAFQHLAPENFGWPQGAGSLINGKINLGGTIGHPSGDAVIEESPIAWSGFTGRVKAKALWKNKQLTVADLNLFKGASSLNVSGEAIWQTEESLIRAKIQGRKILLEDFTADHAGRLDLQGEISGPASALKGDFKLAGSKLEVAGQPITALNAKGRIAAEKIHWDTLTIDVDKGQRLTCRGWYAFDRRFDLTLQGDHIGLSRIVALQKAYPVDGRLNLRLNASGTVDHPLMDARLTVLDPQLNNRPWDDFHMTAAISGQRLTLNADLNFALTSNYYLDSGDFSIDAQFNRSELDPYLAIWAGPDWAGELSGQLRANGNRHRPKQITGELLLGNAALRYQNRTIVGTTNFKAGLKNGRLEVPSNRLSLLEEGFVTLTASGHLPGGLRIASNGRLPLAALSPFVDELGNADGELVFTAKAEGPLEAMQWQSRLDFAETALEVPGLGQRVEGLNGRLDITPDQMVAENLSGRLGSGRFSMNGRLTIANWHPTGGQLHLTAHSLPVQVPDTMDAIVNADVTFKGGKDRPSLTGKMVLLEGSYYKDIKMNLLSAVTQKKRSVDVASSYSFPGRMGQTALDVAVTHRYPLLVDNNLANLAIAPDLKIRGTLDRPLLNGRAQVVEGEVIFRRKSFTVKRGVVDFINPYKIEPQLDIVAQADIRKWLVSLSLSGPPDRMMVKLSSDPAESESDILSLILLGRTSSELAKGEGGSKQTTQQMLASLVATAWGEDVKKHTGVDILEVDTTEDEDAEDPGRVQLTVGKKLSRRLTIKYEVESGSEELVQRAVSEYRFLEHLLASGFQDSKGGYGGELVFRIEF